MNRRKLITTVSIIGIVALAAISLPLASAKAAGGCGDNASAKAETGHGNHGKMDMKTPMEAKPECLEKMHSGHITMVSQSIEKAIKAIEAGDKKTALAELNKAKKMLAAVKDGIGKHVKPKFANARCPIMDSPINPDKVTKNLIREYKGQKIAFCCGGCPAAWDKLTNAEKDAKLAKGKPTPKPMKDDHSNHKH